MSGKSAKRIFALDIPAIHYVVVGGQKDGDARQEAGHGT
jgi:hypothetical protein